MFKLCFRLNFLFFLTVSAAQNESNYFQADPFYLYKKKKDNFSDSTSIQVLDIRPLYKRSSNNKYYLFFKSYYYYNDNAPNLENTSDMWVGKGSNLFNSIHLNYSNSFLSLKKRLIKNILY